MIWLNVYFNQRSLFNRCLDSDMTEKSVIFLQAIKIIALFLQLLV